jgi:hypothetical protein
MVNFECRRKHTASSTSRTDILWVGKLTPSPSKRVLHRSSTEVTDGKQEVLQPPTGAHDAVTTETVIIFWAASDMNEALHFCSVGNISRAKSIAEWKTEHLDYELYRKETKKVSDFDEATCWFRTIEKYTHSRKSDHQHRSTRVQEYLRST